MTSSLLPLAAWVHNLDPFAIRFTSDIGIRWYGLSYLLGFAIGYLLIRRVVAVGRTPLTREQIGDLVVTLAIGLVVGGRLGYAVFYQRSLLTDFSADFPWWGLLAINQGGMASHGGMIGGMAACFWFAYRRGIPAMHLLDILAFGVPLG